MFSLIFSGLALGRVRRRCIECYSKEFRLPSAFEIIKKRWPEVFLIVVFQAGLLILGDQIGSLAEATESAGSEVGEIPSGLAFLLGVGTMSFGIVWLMLYLGFMRTAYTDGCAIRQPGQLVVVGKYYFWRTVRFQIVIGVVYFGIAMVLVSVLGSALFKVQKPEDLPQWLVTVSFSLSSVALVKYMTLTPAVMVGRDMMVRQSVRAVGEYRIAEAGNVVVMYVGLLIVATGTSIAIELVGAEGMVHYILVGCHGVLVSVGLLAVCLEALRFVAEREGVGKEQDGGANGTLPPEDEYDV